MIGVVDYGLGNVQAFLNIYKRLNISATAIKSSADLEVASKIILPGVGAFDWAMSRLESSGMRSALNESVLTRGVPILGVCVGMQMMANRSSEGELDGLGWIDAEVRQLQLTPGEGALKLPHMGWNDVVPENESALFKEINDPRFYFLHSYYFAPNVTSNLLATTSYGREFCSAVQSGNIFGTQFHPEKSHQWGVQLLKNFSEL